MLNKFSTNKIVHKTPNQKSKTHSISFYEYFTVLFYIKVYSFTERLGTFKFIDPLLCTYYYVLRIIYKKEF